jgi:hypothetical protein
MAVDAIWIPARSLTITVAAYNSGTARMVRISGPSGEAGMAPGDPRDWEGMIAWVSDLVAGELAVALGQLDHDAKAAMRRAGIQPPGPLEGTPPHVAALVLRETLDKNREALELAIQYGQIDGAHHKAWVIDQMVRALAGDGYEKVVADACAGDEGPYTYSWDEGIPP